MFKSLDIHLSGPICTCTKNTLQLFIEYSKEKDFTFLIVCKSCEIQVILPNKKINPKFILDEPYPNDKVEVKEYFWDDEGKDKK